MKAFKYIGPEKEFNLRGTVFVKGKATPVEDEALAAKCGAMTGSFEAVALPPAKEAAKADTGKAGK